MLTKTAVKFVVVALPWLLWRWTTSIILAKEVPAKDIHLSKPPKIVTVVDQNVRWRLAIALSITAWSLPDQGR
jgi:hypothetical protein